MSQKLYNQVQGLESRVEALELALEEMSNEEPHTAAIYKVSHRGSRWFDVIDSITGAKANGQHLTKEDAEALCQELNDASIVPTMGGYAPKVRSEGEDVAA